MFISQVSIPITIKERFSPVKNLSSHDCEVFLHISAPTTRTTPAYKRVEAFDDYCEKHQLLHHTLWKRWELPRRSKSYLTHILEQIELNYSGYPKVEFFSGDTLCKCIFKSVNPKVWLSAKRLFFNCI